MSVCLEVLKKLFSSKEIESFRSFKKYFRFEYSDNSVTLVDKIQKVLDGTKKKNKYFFWIPFADKDYLNNLQLISKNKIFKDNHIIIIHRERNSVIILIDFKCFNIKKLWKI